MQSLCWFFTATEMSIMSLILVVKLLTSFFHPLCPGLVKDAARPAYWVPDQDITSCSECQREFAPRLSIHHCRACGQGVCDDCSQERRSVPSRGWDHPVRVCNGCSQKPGEL